MLWASFYHGPTGGGAPDWMAILRTLSRGLLSGLVGSAAMHIFRLGWEAVTNRDPQKGIFGFDTEADVNSVYLIYCCISLERPRKVRAARTGLALHYVYGASLGALYALTKPRVRWIARSSGVAPGALLWIGADELPISLTGISDPFRRSIASHASALLAHVVFAVAVDQMVRGSAATQCIKPGDAYGWKGESMLAWLWTGRRQEAK
jgi:hypothetical protein